MSKDGGPAFPSDPKVLRRSQDGHSIETISHHGMSLRDYFAAAALQGMLAASVSSDQLANLAYVHADAMLRARASGEG